MSRSVRRIGEWLCNKKARFPFVLGLVVAASCGFQVHAVSAEPASASSNSIEQDEAPAWGDEEEFGEFLATPDELSAVPANDIIGSMRLFAQAMSLGEKVYTSNCAICHGADLEGLADRHTPDLTDSSWRFSGDDLASTGRTKFPSDVEWTVRYGIRSGHANARGVEVDMLAFDPLLRNREDIDRFGTGEFLTRTEMADMVEYVLQLSGQPHDAAKAERAARLFQDNAKGNCFDCHGQDGSGRATFGSTDLTRKDLYLYGSDRASILESITSGRRGMMPAFEGSLNPAEIKAVSVFVFSHAQK